MIEPSKLTFAKVTRDETDRPFDDDEIGGRENLAKKLTEFTFRLSRGGGVIAIHAPWGAGKTWFGQRWAEHLGQDRHKVVYIDAFAQDHIEDPFLLIAGEFSQLIEGDEKAKFVKKAGGVAKVVAPAVAKTTLNVAIKWLLRDVDLVKEYEAVSEKIAEESEDALSHWVERKLVDYEKEKESVAGFRVALEEAASKEKRPIVVFVDELDRCRPDFAVRLIERIKHFFETPNVVFVLLLNREQLERSVQGVYGAATDGDAYLSKFIHFFFTLPESSAQSFIQGQMERFALGEHDGTTEFSHSLCFWHRYAGLSLRQIERACALFAYATNHTYGALIAYAAVLKIKRAEIFNRLLEADNSAHSAAMSWLRELASRNERQEHGDWELAYLMEISVVHQVVSGQEGKIEKPFSIIAPNTMSSGHLPRHLAKTLREIDLPIS